MIEIISYFVEILFPSRIFWVALLVVTFLFSLVMHIIQTEKINRFKKKIKKQILYHWSIEEVENFLYNEVHKIPFSSSSALSALVEEKGYNLSQRDRAVMELLVKHGTKIYDGLQYTILKLRETNELDLMIRLLCEIKNITYSWNFLFETFPLRIHKWTDNKLNPLHLAAVIGVSSSTFLYTLVKYPKLEEKTFCGRTALHFAAQNENGFDMVNLLIKHGANLEAKDAIFRSTPILFAALHNRFQIVELLLDCGANLFESDQQNNTILHLIFCKPTVNLELCKLLLQKGCDPNSLNSYESTPLHLMVLNKGLKDKLKFAKILVKYGADINLQSKNGDSTMHAAAQSQDIALLMFLLEQGADMTLQNMLFENVFDVIMNCHGYEKGFNIVMYLAAQQVERNLHIPPIFLEDVWEWSLCNKEASLLKSIVVLKDQNISLLTLFLKSEKKLTELCSSELVRKTMQEFDKWDFPVYGYEMGLKFRKALENHNSISECIELLCSVSDGKIHPPIAKKVMQFISTRNAETIRYNLNNL